MFRELAEGAAHISMSTISVALSDELTDVHTKAGQLYVAAPVFGRPEALKDMRLALAAADAKMVPMPAASLIRDHLIIGVAQGQGDTDWTSLAQICAREAGL